MRKLLISLSAASLSAACFAGFFVGCSSDDSTPATTTDSGTGTDVVTADNYVPPKKDSGTDAGLACLTCNGLILNGPSTGAPPCTDQSLPLFLTWVGCICNTDGGRGCGSTDCANACATVSAPDTACQACIQSQCGPETQACLADGTDAGPTDDAGDGGDGG